MAKDSDRIAKRILAAISIVSGFAAGLVVFAYGVNIAFLLLAFMFLVAGWFAIATPAQISDLFSRLTE